MLEITGSFKASSLISRIVLNENKILSLNSNIKAEIHSGEIKTNATKPCANLKENNIVQQVETDVLVFKL